LISNDFFEERVMSKKKTRHVSQTENGAVAVNMTKSQSGRNREFNPDYSYVKKDLRQIGIMAVAFITILVVLSFVL
jgi:hypothetical protein